MDYFEINLPARQIYYFTSKIKSYIFGWCLDINKYSVSVILFNPHRLDCVVRVVPVSTSAPAHQYLTQGRTRPGCGNDFPRFRCGGPELSLGL